MKFILALLGAGAAAAAFWHVRETRRLAAREAARRAYEEDAYKNGVSAAKSRCRHEHLTLTQSGIPGMVTVTKKWCAVCRADLGAAKLTESLFGAYWS